MTVGDNAPPVPRPEDTGVARRAEQGEEIVADQGESLHPLTAVCRALLLLGLQGLSLGFCLWTMLPGEPLRPFVLNNEIARSGRYFSLNIMFSIAAAICAPALLYLAWRRRAGVQPLQRVANRCTPLILAAFLPLLFEWEIWIHHRTTFVALAAGFGLGAQALFFISLSTPPVFPASAGDAGPAWLKDLRNAAAVMYGRFLAFASAHRNLFPTLIVCLAAAGYAFYFSYYTVINHRNLWTAAYDLGIWDNATWNTLHGGPLLKAAPALGPDGSHLARHATFFIFPLAAVYALSPNAETLLIFQAVMIGAAALPLFLYARRHLGAWTACVVALLYLLYPPVHGANLYDFHFLPLGTFFVWCSLYLIEARRDWLAVIAVLFALSVREDIAAGMIIIGAYLVLGNRRPVAGVMLSLVAAVYLVLLITLIMPAAAKGASYFSGEYADLLPKGERRYTSILKTVFGNPAFTLSQVLKKEKLIYLLQIMTPLAFLPWRRPLGLLLTVPGFFFCLLAHRQPFYEISFQYTTHWTIYLFIAVVVNLAWVGRPRFEGDRLGPARRSAWVAAMIVVMLATSHQYGAILQQNTARGGYGPFRFGRNEAGRVKYLQLHALINEVPARAKMAGSENVVPHFSGRPEAYTMRVGTFDAEYILFQLPGGKKERERFRQVLAGGDFGVVEKKGSFVLAKRGYSTQGNAPILRRLRR